MYRLLVNFTYSSNQAAQSARAGLENALALHPTLQGTVGGTARDATLDALCEDPVLLAAFQADVIAAWGSGVRTSGYATVNKVD